MLVPERWGLAGEGGAMLFRACGGEGLGLDRGRRGMFFLWPRSGRESHLAFLGSRERGWWEGAWC